MKTTANTSAGHASAKVIGLDSYRVLSHQDNNIADISKLAMRLQQSIDVERLMPIFCEETTRIVPCDSVSYTNAKHDMNFQVGKKRPHQCRYRLTLQNEDMGEILCTRRKPFNSREINLLEGLLSLLIFPLRNSLLYFTAVSQSFRDPLTQICNRVAFDLSMAKTLSSFRRNEADFSLIVLDIDYFKKVNDTFGHIAGDEVLKSVAKILRETIRISDEAFRYGGEEFVVILSNTKQPGAQTIAERIRKKIEKLCVESTEQIKITASFGVSCSDAVDDVSEALHHADMALYRAKKQGRNRVVLCNQAARMT